MSDQLRDFIERGAQLQRWLDDNGYGRPQNRKECTTCGQVFSLPDPADVAYDVRVHLTMNPGHQVVTR